MRLVWLKSVGGTNSYDVYRMGGTAQQIESNNQLGLLMIGGDMSGAVNYFAGLSPDNKDDNNDHYNLDF